MPMATKQMQVADAAHRPQVKQLSSILFSFEPLKDYYPRSVVPKSMLTQVKAFPIMLQ